MSTYYYLVCDLHMERTDAASRNYGGTGCHLGGSDKTLLPFIVWHCGCPVRIVSEHEEDAFSERFTDWTEKNVMEMAGRENEL